MTYMTRLALLAVLFAVPACGKRGALQLPDIAHMTPQSAIAEAHS